MNRELGKFLFGNTYFNQYSHLNLLYACQFPIWENLNFIKTEVGGETPQSLPYIILSLSPYHTENNNIKRICPEIDLIIEWIQQPKYQDLKLQPFRQLVQASNKLIGETIQQKQRPIITTDGTPV